MLTVDKLCKSFRIYHSPADRLKELVLRRPFHKTHEALKNVSFHLADGDSLGIVGPNGAGKSTLLKILNGVLLSDSGTVKREGRITGLLELGAGFDPELSGLRNIDTYGLLLGMSEAEIADKTSDIIRFSELEKFIHEPLRTYSSGMKMRLAFSIAIHADPQAFLIDEALSVGDAHFQQKCLRWLREFRQGRGSLIVVSHDLNILKLICDRVMVLDGGQVLVDGDPFKAIDLYLDLITQNGGKSGRSLRPAVPTGEAQATIIRAVVYGESSGSRELTSGEPAILEVEIHAKQLLSNLQLSVLVRDRFGQALFSTDTSRLGGGLAVAENDKLRLHLHFATRLAPGKYTVALGLHSGEKGASHMIEPLQNALEFQVSGFSGVQFTGLCNLEPTLARLTSETGTSTN